MSKEVIILILLFTFSISLLFGLLGFLLKTWFFRPKNNPLKARVYVDGIDRPFNGKFDHASSKGQVYIFNKGMLVVVPKNYPYDYHYNKRTIYLDSLFHLIAYNKSTGYIPSKDEKSSMLTELWHSKIGEQAISKIRSLQKPKISIGLIVVIIVAILLAAMAGYFLHSPVTVQQSIPQQSTANTTTQPNTPYIQKGGN